MAELVSRRRADDLLHEVAQRRSSWSPSWSQRPARATTLRRPGRALPRRLHAAAAPRDRGAAGRRRPAGGRHDRRAGARDRHRRAGRRGRGDVPRDGRVAAADVGPRGPARPRAGGLRRRRGRAGPVLLPPSRRVPRPAGRGGDRQLRERADPRRASALRGARGADRPRRRRGDARARACARTASTWSQGASWSSAAGGSRSRRPEDYPAARVSLRSASPDCFAVVEVDAGRDARHRRVRARAHDGPRRRGLPAHGPLLRGDASWRSTSAARWSSRSRATGTRSPRRRPRRRSSGCSTAARRSGVTLCFGMVSVTETVMAYQRKRLPDHEPIDLQTLDLPETTFTTQALWYELDRALLGDATSRSSSCSARCTPPSTRRSPCCRCWRCATAGTSAACPPTPTRRPAARRSSSTTATPAASGSRSRASAGSSALVGDATG